jgi:transcriptional regulator with XRE-family HTH domain
MKYLNPSLSDAQLLDRCSFTSGQLAVAREAHGHWVQFTRRALGIPSAALAERLQVTQQAVTKFEQNELRGAISLGRLEELAAAMDCVLVYGFAPSQSFEESARALQEGLDEARRNHRTRPRP